MSVRLLLSLLVASLHGIATSSPSSSQSLDSFDNIEFWVGSGNNRTALAIDWDGESASDASYAWGYYWDNMPSGTDLLNEVLAADSRLFAKLSNVAGIGTAVIGLGYDQNDDGQFAITDNAAFDQSGVTFGGLSDGESSTDPNDWYTEGWFLGFWHLASATTDPFDGGSWTSSIAGIDQLALVDDGWLSLAFTTDTESTSVFAENPFPAESPFSADFDSDGDVDGSDFLTWQRGFGILTGATLSQGDANGDERVDHLDLQSWSAAMGSPPTVSSLQSVPEPSSFAFVGTIFLTFFDIHRLLTHVAPWRCP